MRVASLLPGATDMVVALGLEPWLVGVSHECDPPGLSSAIPRLTASALDERPLSPGEIDRAVREALAEGSPLYRVDAATLVALAPDLVLTQGLCEVCAVSGGTLARQGVRLAEVLPQARLVSMTGGSWAGVLEDLQLLARELGAPERGRALAEDLLARWARLPGPDPEGPLVLALEWPDPPFLGGHWVPEQVLQAGARHLGASPGDPSRRAAWPELLEADPDVVLSIACGLDAAANLAELDALARHPEASQLRAFREGRAWALDANRFFSRPGPGLVRGAELVAALLQEPSPSDLDPGEVLRWSPS